MKKLLTLICLLTSMLVMTACGDVNPYLAQRQETKNEQAIVAAQEFVSLLESMAADPEGVQQIASFTGEELEYMLSNDSTNGLKTLVKGKSLSNTVDSFVKAQKTVGTIQSIGNATTAVDGTTIIVTMDITGSLKDGVAEVVMSNDMFLVLQSASLSAKETTGDLMKKAGLNTLLGMGSVFIVLILICLIISCFSLIPKIQKAMTEKKAAKKTDNTTGIHNAVAQIVVQEETRDASDDLELVAVIAAAVAAYEGAASSDGYVVRSIRKIR